MATTTQPLTFQQIIARHTPTLSAAAYTNLGPLTPTSFIQQLEEAYEAFSTGSTLHREGTAFEAALTHLTDAIELDDSDPDKGVLLRNADRHLSQVDPSDF
ncbi:hypothetical protein ACFYXD_35185 [Streptomyces platensis]|uniref:hypothetical protein n=1 Tax=Streptomyces platensis TaxID=58346 RepID=UPI0036C0CD6D